MNPKVTKMLLIFSAALNVFLGNILFIKSSPISQHKNNGLANENEFAAIQGKAEIFARKAV